ncbi:LysR family transcriptional regulator [Promicromonospora sp. Populi]|uniref:LysR family transcriptional regulator n=1 Tax=Promicromonospora sp. Populi TaxID=3239420 RepID=UPI0034E22CB1
MLDVDKLVALRAVATHGSIAAAGRELGYTRSAISQQLTALERAAGTALLIRGAKKVTVTPVGRRLIEHTERILAELRAADAVLRQEAGEVSGELRVGVPFGEGPPVMSGALKGVRARYPLLQITLAATTDADGAEEIRRGNLDVVILSRFGATPGPAGTGLRQWELGHDALRLCVPQGHRLAGAETCTVADLRDDPWVVSPRTPLGQLTLNMCAVAGFRPTIAATVDDMAAALGLVDVGWGVTIAPELTSSVRESTLSRIPLPGVWAFRHTVLLARDGEEESPAIAAVIAAVHETSARFGYTT